MRIDVIGTGVFRHRERAGIDDEVVALGIAADHRGQDRDSDVVHRTRADGRLERIEEDVVAGADLVASGEAVDHGRGRRRADAADEIVRAEQGAKAGDGLHLRVGVVPDLLHILRMVGMAGVREESLEADGRRVAHGQREPRAAGIVGIDTGTVIAAVHLQIDVEHVTARLERAEGTFAVDEHVQPLDSFRQSRRARHFFRGNRHGVRDVAEAGIGEELRLRERRHRDRTGPAAVLQTSDLDRLVRLHVRPERDARGARLLAHPVAVRADARGVHQKSGRCQLR